MTLDDLTLQFPVYKPIYNEQQILAYFNRIHFNYEGPDLPRPSLELLSLLIPLHLQYIPYGNLSMFYYRQLTTDEKHPNSPPNQFDFSTNFGVSIELQDIFDKLVVNNREGYCFEHNLLFKNMLTSLGFSCYGVASRVPNFKYWNSQPSQLILNGFYHLVLIVNFGFEKYFVDVGYGHNCATKPIPLITDRILEDSEVEDIECGLGFKLHIVRRHPPETMLKPDLPYSIGFCLRALNCNDLRWTPLVYFNLDPVADKDIGVLNFFVVMKSDLFIKEHIILRRLVKNESKYGAEEAVFTLLDNRIKIAKFDGKVMEIEEQFFDDEAQRKQAYLHYFNIDVTDLKEHLSSKFISFSKVDKRAVPTL